MDNFTSYVNEFSEYKNSFIFYESKHDKNYFLKKNNTLIVGSYKDPILKRKIYMINNGIMQSTLVDKKMIANNLDYSEKDRKFNKVFPTNKYLTNTFFIPFITSFNLLEDAYLQFNLYPLKYYRNNMSYWRNKQITLTNYKYFNDIFKISSIVNLDKSKFNKKYKTNLYKLRFHNKYINKHPYWLKMERVAWVVRKFNNFFFTDGGWKCVKKKNDRNATKVKNPTKLIRRAKRVEVRLHLKKFLKIQPKFFSFMSNIFLLKNKNKTFLRSFILYKAHIKTFFKLMNINLVRYVKKFYKYSKLKRKKVKKFKQKGSRHLRPLHLFYFVLHFIRTLKILWKKLIAYLNILIYKTFSEEKNVFVKKDLLRTLFSYNEKTYLYTDNIRKEKKWDDYIKRKFLNINECFLLIKYNFYIPLLFKNIYLNQYNLFKKSFLINAYTNFIFLNNDNNYFFKRNNYSFKSLLLKINSKQSIISNMSLFTSLRFKSVINKKKKTNEINKIIRSLMWSFPIKKIKYNLYFFKKVMLKSSLKYTFKKLKISSQKKVSSQIMRTWRSEVIWRILKMLVKYRKKRKKRLKNFAKKNNIKDVSTDIKPIKHFIKKNIILKQKKTKIRFHEEVLKVRKKSLKESKMKMINLEKTKEKTHLNWSKKKKKKKKLNIDSKIIN